MSSLSNTYFEKAKTLIPGGVNSPVRAFKSVGGTPVFMKSAKGAYLYDVDGKSYIDLIGSWGPMLFGQAHPVIENAVREALNDGFSFGAPTYKEVLIAEKICSMVPSIEKVRLVNSGTEATMAAIRLARAYTKRDKIIKFEGCYHGHVDAMLVKAGSGLITFGASSSAGVPESFAQETIVLPLNDIEALKTCVANYKNEIACAIIEPIPANNGLLLQEKTLIEVTYGNDET
jgi:glutamate-1-semialdehyde 2,1-aminomutase